MKRRPWIAAAILFVLLLILGIDGSVTALNKRKAGPGSVGHHEPLPGFGYCSALQTKPCILSFNFDEAGGMLINVLTDSLQDFHIRIKYAEGERIYECKRVREYSVHVSCTGETMPVGEALNFLVISKEKNIPLAQGNFPIIGMALATPEINITPTPYTHQDPR